MLQANGWVAGADGVRQNGSTQLAFTLSVPDINPLPLVAHEVAAQLAAIGVQVTVDTVPPANFLSGTLDSGHFQLAIDAWNPVPDPDVSAFWRSNAVPPHGYNVSGGTPDAFLDAALDMLAESPDRAARISAAAQVAALVADDAPAVFLYTPTGVDGLQIAGADRADAVHRAGVRPVRRHRLVAAATSASSLGTARGR